MHRLKQLMVTLPANLADNIRQEKDIEFVLADIGPTPGLYKWVHENFEPQLASGYLKVRQYRASTFHASIAKNTAHVAACGDILVNLDGDVTVGKGAGLKILNAMKRYGGRAVLHMIGEEGSYGTIAYPRELFHSVGGYDEKFRPVGAQDTDIIVRLVAMHGLAYVTTRPAFFHSHRSGDYLKSLGVDVPLHGTDLPEPRAILNTKSETCRHTRVFSWKEARETNHKKLRRNLNGKSYVANEGKPIGYNPM